MKIASVGIIGILILSLIVPQALADSYENCKQGGCTAEELAAFKLLPLTISTDKTNYDAGDSIMISGILQDTIVEGYQIGLLIQSPIGNVVSVAQVAVTADNKLQQQYKQVKVEFGKNLEHIILKLDTIT